MSRGIPGVLQRLMDDVARRANRTPDGPAGDRRLAQTIAAEADDGSLSVAVGDLVHIADVEL